VILEGIVTTLNPDGTPNVSPMGPQVDADLQRFALRPYRTSTTWHNLQRTGEGVLHVTDDVELFARSAIGIPDPLPAMRKAESVAGVILTDACRWYAFRVLEVDDREARIRLACQVVDQGRQRDFFGFNRAKHAVVEAAILATRLELLPAEQVRAEFARLAVLVAKTGGPQEERAFRFLKEFIESASEGPGGRDPGGRDPGGRDPGGRGSCRAGK
jgi:hypothetical protein